MSKMNLEMQPPEVMSLSDDGFWFFIPSREAWDYWTAEVQLQKDIDFELMLDDIQLFEVS